MTEDSFATGASNANEEPLSLSSDSDSEDGRPECSGGPGSSGDRDVHMVPLAVDIAGAAGEAKESAPVGGGRDGESRGTYGSPELDIEAGCGRLRFYVSDTHYKFQATCNKHKGCSREKTRDRTTKQSRKEPPLSFLSAYLQNGHKFEQRDAHWHYPYSSDEKSQSRTWLEAKPEAKPFFDKELLFNQ